MIFRRILLVALALSMLAAPTYAAAPGETTFYRYASCGSPDFCPTELRVNESHTRILELDVGAKCKKRGASLSASNDKSVKIKRGGRFSAKLDVISRNSEDEFGVLAKLKVSGKITKRKKVTGKYSVKNVASGCASVAHGTFKLKYRGKDAGLFF